jgi:hypothetical protein
LTAKLISKIRILKGLLPICSYCQKIRNKNQEWVHIQKYISEKTDADFTHGICPDCYKKYFESELNKDVF